MTPDKHLVVYRIRGLPPHCTEDEAREVIETLLDDDEKDVLHHRLSLIPSCYHGDDTCGALLTTVTSPRFLAELDKNPLIDWPVESRYGDLNFDRHFHGFTQLYQTERDREITAE